MTDQPTTDNDHAAALYERYAPGVFATCMAMLGIREDAADATHEVFAKALPVLQNVEHPNAWLQTAARHHCSNLIQRRRMAERRGTPAWGSERNERNPEDVVMVRQQALAVLAPLTDRERKALTHAVLRDAPVAEVASRMRMSYAATVQLLARARRRAADVAQLPSALAAPRLRNLSELVRRAAGGAPPAATTPATTLRGTGAGGAILLCVATMLCSSAPGLHSATATRTPPVSAAPRNGATPLPPLAPLTGRIAIPLRQPDTGHLTRSLVGPIAPSTPIPCTGLRSGTSTPPAVVWTDPANDQASLLPAPASGPANDLTWATMATAGDTLVVRIHVRNMSLSLPPGATGMGWGVYVTPGGLIEADVDASGRLTYYDTYASGPGGHPNWVDNGTVVLGPDGYVEIDMPFSHITGLGPATTLTFIGGHAVFNTAGVSQEEVDTVAIRGSYRLPGCSG